MVQRLTVNKRAPASYFPSPPDTTGPVAKSAIEWTDETWNPVSGCTRVSAGCDHCYAVEVTRWLAGVGQTKYAGLVNEGKGHFNGLVRTHGDVLDAPLSWKRPRRVFVNSMSDLFHPGVPEDFVRRVSEVMGRADRHAFQVLTKRPERAAELVDRLPWAPNVLVGTSVEDGRVLDRVDALRAVPAFRRFLSCEPLLGPVGDLDLTGIHWVVVGGESGPRARPMDVGWARDIRDRCVAAGVPLFFKQFGRLSNNPDPDDATAKENGGGAKGGRLLDGRAWDQHPAVPGFRDPHAVGLAVPPPLSDEAWAGVAPVLPGRVGTAGGTGLDNRAFVEAVRWRAWTLRPWRDLPGEYGKWNTAAVRVIRWAEGGHWRAVCDGLGDPFVRRMVGA